MKIPTLWRFVITTLFCALISLILDILTGKKSPTFDANAILIIGFAITWALDRDKEHKK